MSSLPEGLPLEIKKALQAIDFKFDAEKQSKPFYFASYSEVKMRGWNTAANDLKENLAKGFRSCAKRSIFKGQSYRYIEDFKPKHRAIRSYR